VLVDEQSPGGISRLLLCEPVAYSPDGRTLRPPGTGSGDGGNYMSSIARKRRAVWPDRETVYESYRSRPPFDVVAPEALAAYVRWGFVDRPDAQVELACKPEVEATIFEVSGEPIGAPAAWAHLGELTAEPVLACGEHSELPAEWFVAQAEHARAPLVKLDGGHFFLQEDTARAARLLREHLG